MRQRSLFDGSCVYVCPDALAGAGFELLECCLRDGGAALSSDAHAMDVTHVVCQPKEYARFADGRRERFYAIVRPEWVLRTFALQKMLPVDRFSADPRLFFSTLAIAAGSIDKDPRKVIDGLIAHFGGQTIEDAKDTGGATHVLSSDGAQSEASLSEAQRAFQVAYSDADVARQVDSWKQWLDERPSSLDFSLPGCVVAHVGKRAGLSETYHVNYAWIEECVRRKQRMGEAPFSKTRAGANTDVNGTLPSWKTRPDVKMEDLDLVAAASVYLDASSAVAAATGELAVMRKVSAERLAIMQKTLAGAIILIAQHIPSQLKDLVADILKAAKAKVANVPLGTSYSDIVGKVVANASFVVCQYQSGLEYEEAVRQKKQVVSVYWVLAGLGVPSDGGALRQALMKPVKYFGGVRGMENFVITLSGFNSRTVPTREDIQMAIQATAKGEKFKKAQSWNFDNILSPEWLLECLLRWEYFPEAPFRMISSDADAAKVAALNEVVGTNAANEDPALSRQPAPAATDDHAKIAPPATRFDVNDLLDELNESTPKSKKAGGSALKLGDGSAAGLSSILIDTPSKEEDKRALRGLTVPQGSAGQEVGIPEDFEFQFGKKSKSRGKAKAAGKKVLFDEREPESEPTIPRSRRNSKKKSGEGVDETVETRQEEKTALLMESDVDGKLANDKPKRRTSPKTKEPLVTSSRKRKSTGAEVMKEIASSEAAMDKAAPKPAKKNKMAHAAQDVVAAPPAKPTANGDERVFLLTGSREECAVNESIIFSLGGMVSQVSGRIYDPKCTHIITSELKRTEKFVAGCAAGKWILKQSYLDACSAAACFVDEAEHEWGATEADVDEMDPRIWPPVCRFSRNTRASQSAKGALDGWRFIIHPKAVPPADMCERIIAAADGAVIALSSSLDLSAAAASATKQRPVVALVHAELSSRDTWFKKFKTSKLRCINASFLIDYLTKDQANRPMVDDYVL